MKLSNKLYIQRPPNNGLNDFVKSIPYSNIILLELGVYAGEGTEIFCKSKKFNTIFSIDPWLPFYGDNSYAEKTNMELVEKNFDIVFFKYKNIIKKIKGTYSDFLRLYKHVNIDICYIDACHTYEACKNDILSIMNNTPPNIAYAGHDYTQGWPGVVKAVNEILGKPDFVFRDNSWIKYVNKSKVNIINK